MSRVNDAVKDGICYCRGTYHIIPIGRWILRSYDDGFSFMPVFNDFEQYGTFLGIKRYKEQVVKNEQLTALDLLEFCFQCTFYLGHFQCARQFWSIGIESSESSFIVPNPDISKLITESRLHLHKIVDSAHASWPRAQAR